MDDSESIIGISRVARMAIVNDTTTWSIIYGCHSDNSRVVIYDRNIFMIQATAFAACTPNQPLTHAPISVGH